MVFNMDAIYAWIRSTALKMYDTVKNLASTSLRNMIEEDQIQTLTTFETFFVRMCGVILLISCLALIIFDVRTGGGVYTLDKRDNVHRLYANDRKDNKSLAIKGENGNGNDKKESDNDNAFFISKAAENSTMDTLIIEGSQNAIQSGQDTSDKDKASLIGNNTSRNMSSGDGCDKILFRSPLFFDEGGRKSHVPETLNMSQIDQLILFLQEDLALAKSCRQSLSVSLNSENE